MKTILLALAFTFIAITLLRTILLKIRQANEIKTRRQLKSQIEALADDLSTDPNGISLQEAVDLLDIHMVVEIVEELQKMPPGERRLQQAIEITGDENYGRAA